MITLGGPWIDRYLLYHRHNRHYIWTSMFKSCVLTSVCEIIPEPLHGHTSNTVMIQLFKSIEWSVVQMALERSSKALNINLFLSNELIISQISSCTALIVDCLGLKTFYFLQNTWWTTKILYTRLWIIFIYIWEQRNGSVVITFMFIYICI